MKSVRIRNVIIGEGFPKICIPLTGRSRDEILKSAEFASGTGADLYELRGDYLLEGCDGKEVIGALEDVRRVIGNIPLIFTLRSKEEGGAAILPKDNYLNMNFKVAESRLADIIDVEFEKGEAIMERLTSAAHENGSHILVSKHFSNGMPGKDELLSTFIGMRSYPSDIIKIAAMVENEKELLNLLDVSLTLKNEYADRPFTIIGMGKMGMFSRISGGIFGSCLTFAKGMEASAPGQIDALEVRRIIEIFK